MGLGSTAAAWSQPVTHVVLRQPTETDEIELYVRLTMAQLKLGCCNMYSQMPSAKPCQNVFIPGESNKAAQA